MHAPNHHGDERGITVVFFAVALTGILAVSGLVLGGSVGYEAARNAQTAADAAALAGTSALQNHKQSWQTTDAGTVIDEVETAVEDNGAVLEACELIDAEYALTESQVDVLSTCDQLSLLAEAVFQRVAGIRVTVSDTRDVALSAFVDQDTITSRATAAATIQPLARGRSPFMVCTSPQAVGHPALALQPDADDPTGYSVNPGAIGKYFVLWGNQIKALGRDCANPDSAWRGLVALPLDGYALPSTEPTPGNDADWWVGWEGNKSETQFVQDLAGGDACRLGAEDDPGDLASQIGCLMAIPLCLKGNGVTSSSDDASFKLFCLKMGLFQISHVGAATADNTVVPHESPCGVQTTNIICGRFLGAGTAASGQGVAQQPDKHGVAVVKLVQ